jgi:proline iminopeptidase
MRDGQSINEAHKIKHLPIVIIQGRYDMICPVTASWDLYQALGEKGKPNVEHKVIDGCGHSANEKRIEDALVNAADK